METERINEVSVKERKVRLLMDAGGLIPWEYDVATQKYKCDEHFDLAHRFKQEMNDYIERNIIPQDKPKFIESLEFLKRGEAVTSDLICGYVLDGSDEIYYVKYYYTPLQIAQDGSVLSYIGYSKDMTEYVRLVKELEEARKGAERESELKSRFLANVSHEIRTPLNAIVGFSELLINTKDEAEKQEFSRIISNSSESLQLLINDILDLSKLESDKQEVSQEEFDFAMFFDEIARVLFMQIKDSEIEWLVENPYKSLLVRSDKDRILRVINHYATNAIKNTHEGYVKLGYQLSDNMLTIYVEDTGHGISAEDKKRLFHRFEKLDTHTPGTGLGLAIVKASVQVLGGTYGCDSELEKGSRFWVSIPIEVLAQ